MKRCALEENPTLTLFTEVQLIPYLLGKAMPKCPGGGTYGKLTSFGVTAACSLDTGSNNAWHSARTPGTPWAIEADGRSTPIIGGSIIGIPITPGRMNRR